MPTMTNEEWGLKLARHDQLMEEWRTAWASWRPGLPEPVKPQPPKRTRGRPAKPERPPGRRGPRPTLKRARVVNVVMDEDLQEAVHRVRGPLSFSDCVRRLLRLALSAGAAGADAEDPGTMRPSDGGCKK